MPLNFLNPPSKVERKLTETLAFIDSLGASRFDFTEGRMEQWMSYLGHPDRAYPSIHIAGTNGKGSVASFLHSSLLACGFNVGLYTSPHLVDLHERFQINGRLITNRELIDVIDYLRQKMSSPQCPINKITQFEFLTAAAFLWFARKKVEVVVLETGLGGRLDATNVVSRVWASVITNVGMDHMSWLGNSIRQIAHEKAGIIKHGVPVITGARGEARQVIRNVARIKKAPFLVVSAKKRVKGQPKSFEIQLQGAHQIENARVAWSTLNYLSKTVPKLTNKGIIQGLSRASWPGRFEVLTIKSPVGLRRLILDGAHNVDGLKALKKTLNQTHIRPIHLIFGTLKDKDHAGMMKVIQPLVKYWTLVPVDSDRTLNPQHMKSNLKNFKNVTVSPSLREALRLAFSTSSLPIVVAGSLYLIGEVKSMLLKNDVLDGRR